MRSLDKNTFDRTLRLVDGWYSDDHDNWRLNELRLLVFCHESFGDPVSGLETFDGDYGQAITYAQNLPIT